MKNCHVPLLFVVLMLSSGCAMFSAWKTIPPPGGCDQCHTVPISANWQVVYKAPILSDEQVLVLQSINGLRDAAQHHLLDISEGHLYLQAQAGVTLYRDILRDVFDEVLSELLPDRVLPVATLVPLSLAIFARLSRSTPGPSSTGRSQVRSRISRAPSTRTVRGTIRRWRRCEISSSPRSRTRSRARSAGRSSSPPGSPPRRSPSP